MSVVAREPTQEEFTSALTNKDALVYLGHGSGSRYLPSDRISRLDCKAVPILMGCSSAQLKSLGMLHLNNIKSFTKMSVVCPSVVRPSSHFGHGFVTFLVTDRDILVTNGHIL